MLIYVYIFIALTVFTPISVETSYAESSCKDTTMAEIGLNPEGLDLPLMDLGSNRYLGIYQGGLSPGGHNTLFGNLEKNQKHEDEGIKRANAINPLCPDGRPEGCENPKIILLAIGNSQTTPAFCGRRYSEHFPGLKVCYDEEVECMVNSFKHQAEKNKYVNPHVVLIDGPGIVNGGGGAKHWDNFDESNYKEINNALSHLKLSVKQVQVVWVQAMDTSITAPLPGKCAEQIRSNCYKCDGENQKCIEGQCYLMGRSCSNSEECRSNNGSCRQADAFFLIKYMGNISRTLKAHYKNLKMIFFSSNNYSGNTRFEPFLYEC